MPPAPGALLSAALRRVAAAFVRGGRGGRGGHGSGGQPAGRVTPQGPRRGGHGGPERPEPAAPGPPLFGFVRRVWRQVEERPAVILGIPLSAAGVGLVTNWLGVQMLFYPIEFIGPKLWQPEGQPFALFGWQGVVPFRTEKMAARYVAREPRWQGRTDAKNDRLTAIVSQQLLSLSEAFSGVEEGRLGAQLVEPVAEAIRRDCGELWARALRPFLRPVLRQCVAALKKDIDEVLDLDRVVLTAFVRDKQVLVDLFQRVGAAELDFLVGTCGRAGEGRRTNFFYLKKRSSRGCTWASSSASGKRPCGRSSPGPTRSRSRGPSSAT